MSYENLLREQIYKERMRYLELSKMTSNKENKEIQKPSERIFIEYEGLQTDVLCDVLDEFHDRITALENTFIDHEETKHPEIEKPVDKGLLVTQTNRSENPNISPKKGRICDLWDELKVGTIFCFTNEEKTTYKVFKKIVYSTINRLFIRDAHDINWIIDARIADFKYEIEILFQPDPTVSKEETVEKMKARYFKNKFHELESEIERYKIGNGDLVISRDRLEKFNRSLSEEISKLDNEIIELKNKIKELESNPSNSMLLKDESVDKIINQDVTGKVQCHEFTLTLDKLCKTCKHFPRYRGDSSCYRWNIMSSEDTEITEDNFGCNQWEAKDE